jgi:hypothetical protein
VQITSPVFTPFHHLLLYPLFRVSGKYFVFCPEVLFVISRKEGLKKTLCHYGMETLSMSGLSNEE